MNNKIKQAVGLVKTQTGGFFWIRISRSYISTLANYWQKKPNFHYMKIYEIVNYKKGQNHALGRQIGYITLNGFKLDNQGLFETTETLNFKQKHRL